MDTLTVALVIRMTGLLLLTPAQADGGGPMHVLLPQTGHISEPHQAQIGYRAPECASRPDGICWRDMDGWSLEVGAGGAAQRVQLPYPESNLSHNTGLFVSRTLLGPAPETGILKSRVILRSGAVTGTCALGRWNIRRDGPGVPMANVVEWTIPNLPREAAVLRATRLGQPGVTETIRPAANRSGVAELYIRHLPREEIEFMDGVRPEYTPAPLALGEPAAHMHPVYDLLGAGPEKRHLPLYRGESGGDCRRVWPIGRAMPGQKQAGLLQRRLASTAGGLGGLTLLGAMPFTCVIGTGLPDDG